MRGQHVGTGLGRRSFLGAVGLPLAANAAQRTTGSAGAPNIVLILADDLGYGDLGCFGSAIRTPNLDRMAREGMRMVRFYSAAPVSSPARAAILTGRYPVRTGVVSVLMPDSPNGLGPGERTIPKALREVGYRTGCVGKWHLGNKPEFSPESAGFDEFSGIPYSNDMYPLPLLRNGRTVDSSPAQQSLTGWFTSEAVDFIARNREKPFFLFLSHVAPHIPLAPSPAFVRRSGQGTYGDSVYELDAGVGRVLDTLRELELDSNTLVFFTSDNGPWYQGSAGPLQGRKGSTYEGGVRVPAVARWPGRIPADAMCYGLTSTMDLLPTFASVAGAVAGSGDGIDITGLLTGQNETVTREPLLMFDNLNLQCVRWGPWKLHLARYNSPAWSPDPARGRMNLLLPQPELYHVDDDPGENYDRSAEYPDLVAELTAKAERMLLRLPIEAQNSWRETKLRRVQGTPVGALPQPEGT